MYKEMTTEIIFFYPLETIKDRLKMYSQYTARSKDASEEFFMTEDEEDLIKVEADNAIAEAFQVAYKLSKGITDSILSDRTLYVSAVGGGTSNDNLVNPTTYDNVYGFRVNNYRGHNPNIIPVIDKNIETYWINRILTSWFAMTSNADMFKVEASKVAGLFTAYNNSLTELYKPYIGSVTPVYSTEEVEVDDETGEVTEETTTTTTMNDPLYYDTYADFPSSGTTDTTYIDKQYGRSYIWNGTYYVLLGSQTATYSVDFENVNTVVIEHNLNKYMPTVLMTDADGNDWEVDYEPVDVNNGVASWEGLKTGTLYLS